MSCSRRATFGQSAAVAGFGTAISHLIASTVPLRRKSGSSACESAPKRTETILWTIESTEGKPKRASVGGTAGGRDPGGTVGPGGVDRCRAVLCEKAGWEPLFER